MSGRESMDGRYWPTDEAYNLLGIEPMHVHIDGLNITDRVVLITAPQATDPHASDLLEAVGHQLKEAGADVVLIGDEHVHITTLDTDAMARAGWVRIEQAGDGR